jgi:hypothetical protein
LTQLSDAPKIFISYSWTSPEHQAWVLELATQLQDNGIDVTLDRWDLKEGHDSNAFMEKMVVDRTIEKVIIVSDRAYAEKADGRQGGVGTEAQIISPQIYAKAVQSKFVAVVSEVDADGKPFLPAYYGSRIFIDLSNQEIYPQNFEQLVRWIFNKPAFPKPRLGPRPAYLDEQAVLLPTKSRAMRAIDQLQKRSNLSEPALRDYLETLAEGLEPLRLDGKSDPFDQAVIDSIGAFLPYRDEYVQVLTMAARNDPSEGVIAATRRFLEALVVYCYRPANVTTWSEFWFDNYRFITYELFIYTVALLLKYERFSALDNLIGGGFYVGGVQEFSQKPIQGVGAFSFSMDSFEIRKRRLSLNRTSLTADLMQDRSKIAGISFDDVMQADFVLFIRNAFDSLKVKDYNNWYPDTLVYLGHRRAPFEVFARARSKRYFDKLAPVIGASDKAELIEIIAAFKDQRLYLPRWNFHTLNVSELMGIENIATTT